MTGIFDEMEGDVTDWLRRYIVGRLHIGGLSSGSPLPSIRQLAKDSHVDHRRIAEAYRTLAAEGLVEIREGAGVYVSGADPEQTLRAERSRWMSDFMYETWSRRITPSALRSLIDCATTRRIRVGVVDTTRDHRVALMHELRHDFELEVVAWTESSEIDLDLVVGTSFEADAVKAVAGAQGVPPVLVRVDPELARGVVGRLEAGPVVAVVSDPLFAQRAIEFLKAGPYRRRISLVLSASIERLADVEVPRGATMLATRAARRDLGEPDFHLLPHTRFISPSSARALCAAILDRRGVERL